MSLLSRLDALDTSVCASVPKPGKWRWSARPGSQTIDFGTHSWEAMTFQRWGMNGAQPAFLTNTGSGHILEPASKFLVPIPGEEHHKWAKRVDHPVAQLIEQAVNLAPSLSAIARAAVARPWWRGGFEDDAGFDIWRCDGCDAPKDAPGDYAPHREPCRYSALDAAIDAAEGTK